MRYAATIPVTVSAIESVTPVIKEFTLSHAEGGELPGFSAGSHIIVVLRRSDRTFRNPYSLLSSPDDLSHYQIAVRMIDNGRGGSRFLHEQVRVGTRLEITHPLNLFSINTLGRKHILIAGGVGITPIMSMIDQLRKNGMTWELHYAIREKGHDHYGLKLRERDANRVHLYYTSAGHRPEFARILADQPLGTHVYTCGPPSMIDAVGKSANTLGWTDSHIHFEEFTTPPDGKPFDCYLARSELTIHVPAERSLLETMEAVGVDPPYLCRGGVCGQCETDVLELEGELIHNDHWLANEDKASGKKIMPCVSRASCTRLVLDR